MTNGPLHRPRRIPALDGLRGVAAIVVLVHHAALLLPTFARLEYREPVQANPLERLLTVSPLHLLWAGDEAVLVFFVLSGLVLALPVLHRRRFSWRVYYPSRLVRLHLPVLAAALGAAALFTVLPWGSGVVGAGPVRALSPTEVVVDASLLRGSSSFLDPALWSLHYELLFSLLLPIYVLVARRFERAWPVLAVAALSTSTAAHALHVQLVMFLAVFALGVLLAARMDDAALLRDRIESMRRPAIVWWSAAGLTATALTASWLPLPPALSAAIGWPLLLVGATAVVFLAANWPLLRSALETRPVRRLGTVSFSLYLVHMPIVSSLGHLLGEDRAGVAALLSIPCSLIAAWLFSVAVEQPGHRLAQWAGVRVGARAPSSPSRAARPAGQRALVYVPVE